MSNEIMNKIIRIMELSMLINPSGTTREETGNKPTVFVTFCGHCACVQVDIHTTGWSGSESESGVIHTYEAYLDTDEKAEGEIEKALLELEKIYKEIQEGKYNG